MFNFIFDGKLGEILAPVGSPAHAFFLAIQHHKNGDVQNEIIKNPNLANVFESGHYPIHWACRYNNTFVLDLLLSRGKFDSLIKYSH